MSTSISNSSAAAVNNERQTFSGQKRRPINPPEDDVTSSSATTLYDSDLMHQSKRPRTIDELGLSFSRNSLSAPDPPGNYSAGSKRKNDIEDCPKAKIPRTEVAVSSNSDTRQQEQQQNQPIDPPADRNDISPTNVTSELYGSTQHQLDGNPTNLNEHEYRRNSSEMSIDDENNNNSDHDSCDGSSVSESSIRDAMYQLVFGRRQAMPSIGNGNAASGATNYDTVDNKIEQLIRRSRMEATMKGQKSQKQEDNNMDNDEDDVMKMDEDDDHMKGAREYDEDDEWHPGHG